MSAAELVETCIVEGREREAVNAARRLIAVDKTAAPLIREQAARLLIRTGNADEVPDYLSVEAPTSGLRHFTRIHPHDPLAWVELALAQTIGGHTSAAERSMSVAVNLAPNNRHVLRSAARLYLHMDDADRAHAMVARSSATQADPWLIASEIALAEVAERPSRFLKTGNSILTSGAGNPRHMTELAGAVATQELINGNRKKSRRWFTQSMIDPTGSALAQGEWATPTLGGELVAEGKLSTAFENAEAMALHRYRYGQFSDVAEACDRWAAADPFSVRPFEFGSATASYIEDFDKALDFARRGLRIRPDSAALLNAVAFAAASIGELDEASRALSKLRPSDVNRTQRLISTANHGLLAFRRGEISTARQHYQAAIEGFRRAGEHELSARAKVYLAREAIISATEDWGSLLKDAKSAMAKFKESEGIISLRLVEALAETVRSKTAGIVSEHTPEALPASPSVKVTFHAMKALK